MIVATMVLADITLESLIWWLIVGLIAGFLASVVMRGGSYGIVGDIIAGLIGAFIGGVAIWPTWYQYGWWPSWKYHRGLYWRMYLHCTPASHFRWL